MVIFLPFQRRMRRLPLPLPRSRFSCQDCGPTFRSVRTSSLFPMPSCSVSHLLEAVASFFFPGALVVLSVFLNKVVVHSFVATLPSRCFLFLFGRRLISGLAVRHALHLCLSLFFDRMEPDRPQTRGCNWSWNLFRKPSPTSLPRLLLPFFPNLANRFPGKGSVRLTTERHRHLFSLFSQLKGRTLLSRDEREQSLFLDDSHFQRFLLSAPGKTSTVYPLGKEMRATLSSR